MAILALVMAFTFAPVGLILGVIARRQIRQTGEDGDGLALAGIIVGGVVTALFVLMFTQMLNVNSGGTCSSSCSGSSRSPRSPRAAPSGPEHSPARRRRGGSRCSGSRRVVVSARGAHSSGGVNDDVRSMPAARPLPAMTSAILRLASSIISSPSIAEPFLPPASDVAQS